MTPKATLQGISMMISSHGYALLYYHDPLSSKRGQKNCKPGSQNWDTNFFVLLLVMVTSSLYGNLFMALSEADSQDFSWAVLKTSPRMMYHQATPAVIWTQTDVSWTNLVLVTTALYAISLQNPCTLDRYQAVPSQGSSVRLSIHGKGKHFYTSVAQANKQTKQSTVLNSLSKHKTPTHPPSHFQRCRLPFRWPFSPLTSAFERFP